ncbi:MAG: hypothetical protein KDB53_04915 [Planctomycetes bacterium]|nr:hypothetical protein [Planctomycetota bacterium]
MSTSIVLRRLARVTSLVCALVLLAFLSPAEFGRPTAREWVGLLLFPGGVLLGFAVAWRREFLGGAITVGSLVLFYVWMFAFGGRLPSGPYFILLAVPGFLYLASALTRGSSHRPID